MKTPTKTQTKTKKTDDDAEVKYPRRDARRRQTRENILEAARELFQAKGYDAVKMTDIAEAADVHITTMFIHFGTKRDLAEALADIELEALQRAIDTAQGRTPFFTFFRNLVTRWAKEVKSGRKDGASFSQDVRSNPELTLSWLVHHKREVMLYARYFAADYGMDAEKDLPPFLVATMLTGGNVVAHDRWMRSKGRVDLLKGALAAIDVCQQMVENTYGQPGDPKASGQVGEI